MRWLSHPIAADNLSGSGIYAIWCIDTGRSYVGSAVVLFRRMAKHRACLRGGYHANQYLQNSYNKYGEDRFSFEVLELCDRSVILERENFWINHLGSHEEKSGMNMLPAAGTRAGSKLTFEQKQSMSSKLKEVHRLNPDIGKRSGANRIGRKNSADHIKKTADGCSKNFSFKSPDGAIVTGKNMANFCREHGLNRGHISMLFNGIVKKCQGWTLA